MFHASKPPDEENLTPSLVLNELWDVCVLVIPDVEFPFGSVFAKQNSISVSAANDWNAEGVFDASAFVLLKSSFKIFKLIYVR